MSKITITFFLAVLVGIGINPHASLAQEAQDDGFYIAVNEDEALSDEEKFLRAHEGLKKALSLALEKVVALKTDLTAREFGDETRELELKALYLEDLSAYETYYSESLVKADALQDLETVQSLAQEIKTYRDTTYTPGIEKVVEFVLIFYSEDVINTARERFIKISEDIEKLETLGLIGDGAFDEELSSIDTMLTEAMSLRTQAKDIVLVVPAVEGSTTTPVTADDTSTTVTEAMLEATMPAIVEGTDDLGVEQTAQTLLETSLNNVKGAYDSFLEVSKSVKQILGL